MCENWGMTVPASASLNLEQHIAWLLLLLLFSQNARGGVGMSVRLLCLFFKSHRSKSMFAAIFSSLQNLW
jgi:hypothetical protein